MDLGGGELRDGDDAVRFGGGAAGLVGEAAAEFGRGVIAGEYEQVMKCGDGTARANGGEALVESVEEIGAAGD